MSDDEVGLVSDSSLDSASAPWRDPMELITKTEHSTISVTDSTEVQIGPRLLYNAPVTINQYVTTTLSAPHELAHTALTGTQQGLRDGDTVSTTPVKCVIASDQSYSRQAICSRTALMILLLVAIVAILVGSVLAVHFLRPRQQETASYVDELPSLTPPPDNANPNRTLPGGYRILSKAQWGGRPAIVNRVRYNLTHPTTYVIISHTAGAVCFDTNACAKICRTIQDDNVGGTLKSADIVCNFLVGGDGSVFEGRGWDITNPRVGFPAGIKRNNVDVCMLGNFVYDEPTTAQLEAARQLLELGVRLAKLAKYYHLLAHNDTTPNLSPGANIYKHMKQWPHFTLPSDAQ